MALSKNMWTGRTPVELDGIIRALGGSYCLVAQEELNGARHVELEGGNGRIVQVVTTNGQAQAWLVGR